MDFAFKLFGVPYGFEIYNGTPNEQNYFQMFYNGSNENTKFIIHRMGSGSVSYSYLRYNFVSGSNRTGSFFGMSVLFKNEYCADVEYLYKLFDQVYSTILQNKILLEEIQGNPDLQARYKVQSFTEVEGEVDRIEKIIRKNIEKECTDDMFPLDNSFNQGNANLIRKLKDDKGNAAYLNAMRKYSWVNISPEYDDNEGLSSDGIAKIDLEIKKIIDDFQTFSLKLAEDKDIRTEIELNLAQIVNIKTTLSPYLQTQPELLKLNNESTDLLTKLDVLLNTVEAKIQAKEKKTHNKKKNQTFGTNTETTTDEKTDINTSEENIVSPNKGKPIKPILVYWRKHKLLMIALAILITLFTLLGIYYFIFKTNDLGKKVGSENYSQNNQENIAKMIEDGNYALNNNDFSTAIQKFSLVGREDQVELVKSKAIQYWQDQASKASREQKWQDAIDFLSKTRDYGGYPALERDINDFQKKIPVVKDESQNKKESNKKNNFKKSDNDTPISDLLTVYKNVKIQLSSKNPRFNIGDSFKATAKSGQDICIGGYWTCDEGIDVIKNDNPTTVKITSAPEGGSKLYYWINSEKVATVLIKINL